MLGSVSAWAQGRGAPDFGVAMNMNRSSLREDIARFNAERAQGRSGWGAAPEVREGRGMRSEMPIRGGPPPGRFGGRRGARD